MTFQLDKVGIVAFAPEDDSSVNATCEDTTLEVDAAIVECEERYASDLHSSMRVFRSSTCVWSRYLTDVNSKGQFAITSTLLLLDLMTLPSINSFLLRGAFKRSLLQTTMSN